MIAHLHRIAAVAHHRAAALLVPFLALPLACAGAERLPTVEVMRPGDLVARMESSSARAVLLNFWASW